MCNQGWNECIFYLTVITLLLILTLSLFLSLFLFFSLFLSLSLSFSLFPSLSFLYIFSLSLFSISFLYLFSLSLFSISFLYLFLALSLSSCIVALEVTICCKFILSCNKKCHAEKFAIKDKRRKNIERESVGGERERERERQRDRERGRTREKNIIVCKEKSNIMMRKGEKWLKMH